MGSTFTMYARELMLRRLLIPEIDAPLQIALTRSIPVTNATAAQLVEPTTGGYIRQDYSAGLTWWAPSGFGELYNTSEVVYPQVGIEGWGLIRGWAVLDPVSGQCISVGSILDPFAAVPGMIPKLAPGVILLGLYD